MLEPIKITLESLNLGTIAPVSIAIIGALGILLTDIFNKNKDKSLYVILVVLFLIFDLFTLLAFNGDSRGLFDLMLLDGIGDTLRVSMTGELEEEIKVGRAILKDLGISKEGLNIISCPTCGRIEADLVSAVSEIEKRTAHIKTPLDVSVMGCVVNAIGEAKSADVAIAFGKGSGLVMKKGEIIAKLSGDALINKFVEEVEFEAKRKI
jgi:hypothetical protein